MDHPNQFMIFGVCQLASAGGMLVAFIGLWVESKVIIVIGTIAYAISTFPSFPIMMELIGKRVGKELELVATGNVFILTQIISAILIILVSYIIEGDPRPELKLPSVITFAIMVVLLLLNYLLGYIAGEKYKIPLDKEIDKF